jgi:hypothetical protein
MCRRAVGDDVGMVERGADPEARDAWSYARIDLDGERWRDFVHRRELEDWGKPRTLLARGPRPGAPTAWAQWDVFLATEPPLFLGTSDAASLTRAFPVDDGGWQPIPVAASGLVDALSWVAEHVGPCVEPAGAARDRLLRELDELPVGYRRIVAAGRELPETLLHERVPPRAVTAVVQGDRELDRERLIEWLMETRARVIEPLIPADRQVFYGFDPDRHRGEPYGIAYSLITVSSAHRQRRLAADDAGWQQLARRLRRAPLPPLVTVDLAPLDGSGRLSRHGGRARVTVWPPGGAVPDRGWFVSIGVSVPMVVAAGVTRLEWSLLDAAVRWSAVAPASAGYVSVDDVTDPSPVGMSPWEAATLAHFTPAHPTTTTRGVHWATYLTPTQWAAVEQAWARLPAGVASHAVVGSAVSNQAGATGLEATDPEVTSQAGATGPEATGPDGTSQAGATGPEATGPDGTSQAGATGPDVTGQTGAGHARAGSAAGKAAGHGAWLTLGDDAHARDLPGKAAVEEILAPWLPVIPTAGFAYLDRG